MRVIVAGTGRLAVSLFEALEESRHEVVGVLQNGRRVRGFRRAAGTWLGAALGGSSSLAGQARRRRIPVIWIDTMSDEELTPIRALQPDLILVGGFSIILKPPLLELPRAGCVNVHSSLLPKFRGPNPFSAVILAGESETGITYHIMDPGIDTGPIIAQYRIPLAPDESAARLYYRCCLLARETAAGAVDQIEEEGLRGLPQDESQASYQPRRRSKEMFIDWTRPAEEIDRLVRAGTVPPFARFRHRKRVVFVQQTAYDSNQVDSPPGTVLEVGQDVRVATGKGTLTIQMAHALRGILWPWPSVWFRVRPGDRLE